MSVTEYKLLKPKSDTIFEDMVLDYCNVKYTHSEKYGKNGQKQYGVDIICYKDEFSDENRIAVQCKHYESISTKDIHTIIKKLKDFKYNLCNFIIALSTDRDRKIQDCVLDANSQSDIPISVIFWDNIQEVILSEEKLLKKYYPQYDVDRSKNENKNSLANLFNKAIEKYNIITFIQTDPTLGFHICFPEAVDQFCAYMEMELNRHITKQNESTYKAIRSFISRISSYSGYLSVIMMSDGRYCKLIKPISHAKLLQIEETVKKYKQRLDVEYSKINIGCSLFN